MAITSAVSLLVILALGILSSPPFAGRRQYFFRRRGAITVAAVVLAVAGAASYLTYSQFIIWQGNEIGKYLLPPYAPALYFARYAFMRFWASYIISGIGAVGAFFGAWLLNKKFNERFFEQEELYFLAFGVFLSGHPGWIVYVMLASALYVVLTSIKKGKRTSFYYAWLPCAALVIVLSSYFSQVAWYAGFFI